MHAKKKVEKGKVEVIERTRKKLDMIGVRENWAEWLFINVWGYVNGKLIMRIQSIVFIVVAL